MADCNPCLTLSVVCPIYNEEKYIGQCIHSILEQDFPHNDMEILFVDGMSTDKTRDIVREYSGKYPFIKLLDNPLRIVPTAMNIGIQASAAKIIIRLDAHAIYPDNYFSRLIYELDRLNASNVGGVCRTLPANGSPKCRAIAAALGSSFGMGNSHFRIGADKIMRVDTVPFGCFRRELFHKVGLYDQELVRNQDDELNGRIIKSGGTIYLIPDLVIEYFARDSIGKTARMFYQYGLFKPLVNRKLGSPATIRQFFPLAFVIGLVLGLFLSLFSRILAMAYISVLVLYLVLALVSSMRNFHSFRQVVNQILVYFVIHTSYGAGYLVGIFKLLTNAPFAAQTNR